MAIKIAIANMKGGVGKTTTATALSWALRDPKIAGKKYKVLLVDCDPQRSATGVYGAKIKDTYTLADIMYNGTDAKECVQKLPMGDFIASDSALMDAETQIKADADRFYHISDSFKSLEKEYDYILFDCSPGNGVLLGNVLSYATCVVMPISCDKFGVQGMVDFADVMSTYTKRINPDLKIAGVLMIKYKGRQSLTKDLEDNLIPARVEKMGTKLFKTKIRESVKCQESQALNKNLFEYAPGCTTAEDYAAFTKELIKEMKK